MQILRRVQNNYSRNKFERKEDDLCKKRKSLADNVIFVGRNSEYMATLTFVLPALVLGTVLATVMLKLKMADSKNNIDSRKRYYSSDHTHAFKTANGKVQNERTTDTSYWIAGTNDNNIAGDGYVTLIHGDVKHWIKMESSSGYPSFLDPSVTILTTKTLPTDRFMPTIGNGHVATVVHSDTVYANALYNGQNVHSHRARIPSTCSVSIVNVSSAVQAVDYSLDLGRGLYIERHASRNFLIEVKMYAHQILNRLLVTEIIVSNDDPKPITVNLSQKMVPESEDIEFKTVVKNNTRFMEGYPKEIEYNSSKRVFISIVASEVPQDITVLPGQVFRHLYLTSIDYDSSRAVEYFTEGINYFMNGTLEKSHVLAWEDIWQKGRIDMEGNKTLSQINYASMYYIISGIPMYEEGESFVGLSPGDLAHGGSDMDYMGHVFWDQETWMFPPILFLHADKGKKLIKTRIRTHSAAKQYALWRGYEGAMFPWESAYTGLNVCPSDDCSFYEQHITGDIAFAIKQYMMMTNDTDFLRLEGGADLINDIALFWASRVEYDGQTNQYHINEVMPPDEYHFPVNDSVYTNCIARQALTLPAYALPLINVKPVRAFEDIAKAIYVPFHDDNMWHPEYDGYRQGTIVKQADVILMGFPLNLGLAAHVRQNDLHIYQAATPGGPAMTWGMFAIGWMEIKEMELATGAFEKQFLNVVPPFNVWSEEPKGQGAVNFITGMGGYLQSVLFGFGGFRMYTDRLDFDPTIPPGVHTLNITGIDYLGGDFDLSFTESSIIINQTAPGNRNFMIVFDATLQNKTLTVGHPVQIRKQKASLVPYGPSTK